MEKNILLNKKRKSEIKLGEDKQEEELNKIKNTIKLINNEINELLKNIDILNTLGNNKYKLNIRSLYINDITLKGKNRSSFKITYELYEQKDKELYIELKNQLKNKEDEIILNDFNIGYPKPNTYYWPSLEKYLFIKISENDNIDSEEIINIIRKNNFNNYTYVIYELELKNNKFRYIHYMYIKFNKEQSIITNFFSDWYILNLKKRKRYDILNIRSGTIGGTKNAVYRKYVYFWNDKKDFKISTNDELTKINNIITHINIDFINKKIKLIEDDDVIILEKNDIDYIVKKNALNYRFYKYMYDK